MQWKFSQPTLLHNIKGTYHRESVWGSSTLLFLESDVKIWGNSFILKTEKNNCLKQFQTMIFTICKSHLQGLTIQRFYIWHFLDFKALNWISTLSTQMLVLIVLGKGRMVEQHLLFAQCIVKQWLGLLHHSFKGVIYIL